ncbi:hypothetical protein [Arthrobacter sp. UYCu511]|uniref:hypothetical protein n=1 Tax=Arthrobacter sp. UYCu511 TaxID=3156337 RepID=UPI0033969EE6
MSVWPTRCSNVIAASFASATLGAGGAGATLACVGGTEALPGDDDRGAVLVAGGPVCAGAVLAGAVLAGDI